MILTIAQVAAGTRCPLDAVTAHWPELSAQLEAHGPTSGNAEVGLAATIAVETAYLFRPIPERWPKGETAEQYFARYAPPNRVAVDLGNHSIEDAVSYRGRGFIQITGRANYAKYGIRLGLDLLTIPERALDPDVSAAIAACYWADRHITAKCDANDWIGVRKAVNGGTANLTEFQDIVNRLLTDLPDAPDVPEGE